MIVRVSHLPSEARKIEFCESAAAVNDLVAQAPGWSEQKIDEDLAVAGEIYRYGDEVTFVGTVAAAVVASCPRCLDEFRWRLERDFEFVIAPASGRADEDDDAGLAHYAGDEIDLAPLVREQAILGLDDARTCAEECRGLCAGCGANLNREACRCR